MVAASVIRPSRHELLAARGKTVPDVIAPGLSILFCGINPGLYSAAVGHHFARPGNRFWPALHAAGLTDRLLSPAQEQELLPLGYGVTNIVNRATAAAGELTENELRAGAAELTRKVRRYRPGVLAVLGVGAFRAAFADNRAKVGPQERSIGRTGIWLLPNPSGLNAHYQPADIAQQLRALRNFAQRAR